MKLKALFKWSETTQVNPYLANLTISIEFFKGFYFMLSKVCTVFDNHRKHEKNFINLKSNKNWTTKSFVYGVLWLYGSLDGGTNVTRIDSRFRYISFFQRKTKALYHHEHPIFPPKMGKICCKTRLGCIVEENNLKFKFILSYNVSAFLIAFTAKQGEMCRFVSLLEKVGEGFLPWLGL